MPSQKLLFGLFSVAIAFVSLYAKPELFDLIGKNFPTSLLSPSVVCSSRDLSKEFQRRFDDKVTSLKRGNNGPDDSKRLDHYAFHIESTETLGKAGNLLSCSMDYTLMEGTPVETFRFLLGRDDDGHLVWHYDPRDIAPYHRPF